MSPGACYKCLMNTARKGRIKMYLPKTFRIVLLFSGLTQVSLAQNSGFVYVATNSTTGNAVIQYSRGNDGSLTKVSEAATGGLGGSGNGVGNLDPLGSQDSLVLSGSGGILLAVNAGSNQIASLSAGRPGLRLVSNVSSGGSFPNSVALNGSL